jgi:ribosomal protein S18 acetylase RimI-like enzyme
MIRLLAPADAAVYRQLRLKALSSDPKAFLSSVEFEEKIPLIDFANKLFRNATPPVYGFYGYLNQENALAGYIHLANEWIFKRRHIATLNELYILPDFRRQGIAAGLIKHCFSLLKNISGKEQVELHVNSGNFQAVKLYQKLGFSQVATIPKAVKELDEYQDEHVFIYNI